VRQALTLAIDRQEIVSALLGDRERNLAFGEVCKGPILPIIWAYHPELRDFPHDPARAKQLLEEEGWKDQDGDGYLERDGKRFSFTLKTNQENLIRKAITVMVQDMLKEVGIEVRPNPLDGNTFLSDLKGKDFEAAVGGWSVGLKTDLSVYWHSNSINDKFNHISYSNPELDRILDEAVFEMDREKARKLWWRAQEILVEDQPYTFLYIPKQINFVHQRFRNVQMHTIAWLYNLEQWWVPRSEQKYR
jgi:peptide/nickel transport system substrate-binding protein